MRILSSRVAVSGFLVGCVALTAGVGGCQDSFKNCEDSLTCGGGDGDGDTGGTGPGDGDGDVTGGNGGDGGETGNPCDECGGDEPACKDATTCVECTEADTSACTGDEDICDPDTDSCVECYEAVHCEDPAAPMCDDGACSVGCQSNNDCMRFDDTKVCDVDTGECVACTGTDYAECGVDTGNTDDPFVCDSLNKTCSTTATEGGATLCQPCISDAHCAVGQACVLQEFDGEEVGYFCFTKPGVDGNPLACNRPYVDLLTAAETIDSDTPDICGLAVTSCPALNDFRSPEIDCRPDDATPDDSLCGAEGLDDGYCRIFQDFAGEENDVYRCTVQCGSEDDCKDGFACVAGSPDLCEL